MIYIIAGCARCGKSTLAKKIRKNFDGQVISGDSARVALRNVSKPEWHPDIFDKDVDPLRDGDPPTKRIERLKRRDAAAWMFLGHYFESVAFAGDDVLVDGIIWPSMLAEYGRDHRAIFLVDTSPDQLQRMIHIRDNEQYGNWMKDVKYTDEKLRQWVDFNIERSKEIINECNRFEYKYFDVGTLGYEESQKQAAEFLLG